jgi:hypothetical protein
MDLLSAIEELKTQKSITGFPCSVGTFLDSIGEKEREAFNGILINTKVGTVAIHEMLSRNEFDVARAALYKHRRKQCRCFR